MNIPFLKKRETIKYYRSCEHLSIYRFHKIMETGNYCFLVKDWNEENEIEINKEEALSIWGGIYNEYCKLTSNNKAIEYYRTSQSIAYLETRREVVGRILVQLTMRTMKPEIFKEYIETIRRFDFVYEGDLPDVKKLEDLSRQIRAANNEIELLKDTLQKLVSTGEGLPFEKELVKVEQALGRNIIDPRTTSVKKWVYLLEEIKEIVEQRRQQAAKNGRK